MINGRILTLIVLKKCLKGLEINDGNDVGVSEERKKVVKEYLDFENVRTSRVR
jgi:hypothetical protein